MPLLALLLLLMPWQQAAVGTGRVIAFSPAERAQQVQAPVSARIDRWHVLEGQLVEEGDPLVSLVDVDADRLDRLQGQVDANDDEQGGIAAQLSRVDAKINASRAAVDSVQAEYWQKQASLRSKRVGVVAKLEADAIQADRILRLQAEGIASQRELELAQMSLRTSEATLAALDDELLSVRGASAKAVAEAQVKLADAEGQRQKTLTQLASVRGKKLGLESNVSRQEAQVIRAPRAGRVLRLYGGPGGAVVKQGEAVLTLVPEAGERAVELWVDGNDLPLVQRGEAVRLVFEGWPALQFVGLPGSSRLGTFPGEVAFVDAMDDGSGNFRVVIRPLESSTEPWPDSEYLLQGVRVKGWVLLGRVSLGYELWRRLNGFPASVPVDKGEAVSLPSNKKPRVPSELKQ